MFSLMSRVSDRHHFIHLDATVKADLAWWNCFLESWHGASFVITDDSTALHVHSDTSGNCGCGALALDERWLQVKWPSSWEGVDISVKEMVPIVMAAATWGRSWHRCRVFFHSDNAAVVAVIQRRSAKHPVLLHLLR